MSTTAPKTDFVRARRMHERGKYDHATIHAILDAAPMCHVGHVIDGRPVVIPTFHWRSGDTVFWHGSSASRMVKENVAGGLVCLTASILDGYVLARSGYNHSANYRSVMCFGTPRLVSDPEEKMAALKAFMDRLVPGRWEGLRPPNEREMKATSVLALLIDEASAKVRAAPPGDDPGDETWPIWGGVLPVRLMAGAAEPDQYVQGRFQSPATPLADG
jgi:uncharacterized protein